MGQKVRQDRLAWKEDGVEFTGINGLFYGKGREHNWNISSKSARKGSGAGETDRVLRKQIAQVEA